MDDLLTKLGIGGGGGFVGSILSYIGFKSKIQGLEKDIDEVKKEARYTVTCIAIHEAIDKRLVNIETMQLETRKDIKKLLAR